MQTHICPLYSTVHEHGPNMGICSCACLFACIRIRLELFSPAFVLKSPRPQTLSQTCAIVNTDRVHDSSSFAAIYRKDYCPVKSTLGTGLNLCTSENRCAALRKYRNGAFHTHQTRCFATTGASALHTPFYICALVLCGRKLGLLVMDRSLAFFGVLGYVSFSWHSHTHTLMASSV